MDAKKAGSILILTVVFFFVAGLSCGAFSERLLEQEAFQTAAGYIRGMQQPAMEAAAPFWELALKPFLHNALLLIVAAAGAFSVAGFPLVFAVLLFKGACLGFTLALMAEVMEAGPFLKAAVFLLPQNLIVIPALLVFCIAGLCFSFQILGEGGKRGRRLLYRRGAGGLFLCFLLSAAALGAGAVTEAFFAGLS